MILNEKGFAHILIIGVITGLFVTGTGTMVLSNSSKPGDILYSIDRGAERLQLALAFTDGGKKEAHAKLAIERLEELEALYTEDELDTVGINDAIKNFEDHKAKLADLSDDDGTVDERETELEHKVVDKASAIDKAAEVVQKSLEDQREALKKQYEQALKDGDTALAAKLKAEIDGFEVLLKQNEQQREDAKQAAEKQDEADKEAAEDEKKLAEEQAEAARKAEEERLEAEKKAAETN